MHCTIEGLKKINFLYWPPVPWEEADWKPVIESYSSLFAAEDPVVLVVVTQGFSPLTKKNSQEKLEGISREINSFLLNTGRLPGRVAEILLLDSQAASLGAGPISFQCQAFVTTRNDEILPGVSLPVVSGTSPADLAAEMKSFYMSQIENAGKNTEKGVSEKVASPGSGKCQKPVPHQKYSLYHVDGREEAMKQWEAPYANLFRGCQRVLDVGCGPGFFLELLGERGIPAEGLDCDPEMAAYCQEKGFKAIVADARQLEMLNGIYDGIHAGHVIEHMHGPEAVRFLEECTRLLRAGGLLVIRTPNWENATVREGGFWLDYTHVRPYPLPLLQRIFLDLGFEILGSGREETGWNDLYIVGRWGRQGS